MSTIQARTTATTADPIDDDGVGRSRGCRRPRSRSAGISGSRSPGLVEERDAEVAEDRCGSSRVDEPPVPPAQRPVRVGEDESGKRHERKVPEDGPDRPAPRLVGLGERRDEPQVTRRRKEETRGVVGTPPERDEPGCHERDSGSDRERRDEPRVVVMVAREDKGDRDHGLDEHRDARDREPQRPHGSRAVTAAPDSSAFGTKPLAPLDAISEP